MSKLIKKEDLQVIGGNYLMYKGKEPVTNEEFVKAQMDAHLLITLAEKIKGKKFTIDEEVTSFDKVLSEVKDSITSEKEETYVEAPEKPSTDLTDKLVAEGLAWHEFEQEKEGVEEINKFMQRFNILKDFEAHGLFFSEGVVRIPNIYKVEEIVEAVKALKPHLNSISF